MDEPPKVIPRSDACESFLSGDRGAYVVVIRFQIQHMQHYTQHDMQHSNPHTTHPQGLGGGGGGWGGPLGMGWLGVRMLHIILCIMLHVLDLLLHFPGLRGLRLL